MTPPSDRHIRLVPELRAVHLERLESVTPATVLYFAENYDLTGSAVPPGIRKVGLAAAACILFSSRAEILELPEPLWMRFLPRNLVLGVSWKLGGAVLRRRRKLVSYAMENNDFARLVGGRHRFPRVGVRAIGLLAGAFSRFAFDRICFASPQSARLYASLPFTSGVETQTVLELPAELVLPRHASQSPPQPQSQLPLQSRSVAFVGAFELRKGVAQLLEAWETVEQRRPGSRLTLVGTGPLSGVISEWAARSPSTRRLAGFLDRTAVVALLAESAALVAPSVRDGRWREQIGLPIKEALSVGTRVVTTDETGLADWLSTHGHVVLPTVDGLLDSSPLAEAMIQVLERPDEDSLSARESRRRDLPPVDGRIVADRWLHGSEPEG